MGIKYDTVDFPQPVQVHWIALLYKLIAVYYIYII